MAPRPLSIPVRIKQDYFKLTHYPAIRRGPEGSRTLVLVLRSREKGDHKVITARTFLGQRCASCRANMPPRLHPTNSTLRRSSSSSRRLSSSSSVLALAPVFSPKSHGCT